MVKFVTAIFGVLIIVTSAHAADNKLGKQAQDFIGSLSNQVTTINQDRSIDTTTRRQKFMQLVETGFDLPWIAKFVVGYELGVSYFSMKGVCGGLTPSS